ncbi:MAG TPA: hypothetical protein DCG57_18640 [Candidatus Riflebacteria bacterium]|nr:hypothetical protein [Candidatus Riflebacteria bacterium]
MGVERKKKRGRLLTFVLSFFLILAILFTALVLMENEAGKNFRAELKARFETELIVTDQWPHAQSFDALYVLGGNIRAQRYKFNVVAKVYAQNICRKIYLMSNKGKMGYDANIAKNLTVDQWSFLTLDNAGVSSADVGAISMGKGVFGTMNEAEEVAAVVLKNGHRNLLLVASPYHSKRVRVTFEHFLNGSGVDVVVLGSGEPKYLRSLFMEWLKLKLYKVLFMLN